MTRRRAEEILGGMSSRMFVTSQAHSDSGPPGNRLGHCGRDQGGRRDFGEWLHNGQSADGLTS